MNNAILIQHAYPPNTHLDEDFARMLELTRARNEAYCKKFAFDFVCEVSSDEQRRPLLSGAWLKLELIRKAMEQGYEYIVWLDSDALIYDVDVDLRDAIQKDKIGVCWHRIPQLNHWNIGVMYIHNSEATREFFDKWIASYPPPKDGWNEQGVFNRMGRESKTVATISDKWNATIDVSMVPDAVVLGFHGQGNHEYRFNMMKETMEQITKREGAQAGQVSPEAR